MEKNIFVIFTAFLAVVVVALLFTIATLQSENDKLAKPTDTTTMLQLEVCMLVYKALDRSNTKIQVNMNK